MQDFSLERGLIEWWQADQMENVGVVTAKRILMA